MMDELLPSGVVSVESWGDDDAAYLFPAERAQVARAIESRTREFATARACARQALDKLASPPVAILCGSRGEPIWPPGVAGSITHCSGYRAAAVTLQTKALAIGIDAEVHDQLPPGVLQSVCVPEEIAWLSKTSHGVHWDRVIFSAKESVYKAWFPLTKLWLDFEQVVVMIEADEGTFHVRPLDSVPEELAPLLKRLLGRFMVRNGIVLTAAICPTGE